MNRRNSTIISLGICSLLIIALAGTWVWHMKATYIPVSKEAPAAKEDLVLCEDLAKDETYDTTYKGSKYLIAGKDGWIFRTKSDLIQDFTLKPNTIKILSRIQEKLKERNIDLVLVVQPTRGIMEGEHLDYKNSRAQKYDQKKARSSFKELLSTLNKAGIVAPDLTTGLNTNDFFYKRDIHWNEYGAEYAAKETAKAVKKLKSAKDIQHIDFTTTVSDDGEAIDGSMKQAAEKICNMKLPDETYHKRETEAAKGAADENDLFGDTKEPEIILLGTSNSTIHVNFSGALKQFIGADILNLAIAGGGIDTSPLDYFSSDFFRTKPPKIIIWELPGHYNLNDSTLYNQIVPAIEGACTGTQRLEEKSFTLGENISLFDTIPGNKHPLGKVYVHLNIPDELPRKLVLKADYAGKNPKQFNLLSSDRMKRHDFYIELPSGIGKPVTNIRLESTADAKGLGTVKLCEYGAIKSP